MKTSLLQTLDSFFYFNIFAFSHYTYLKELQRSGVPYGIYIYPMFIISFVLVYFVIPSDFLVLLPLSGAIILEQACWQ